MAAMTGVLNQLLFMLEFYGDDNEVGSAHSGANELHCLFSLRTPIILVIGLLAWLSFPLHK